MSLKMFGGKITCIPFLRLLTLLVVVVTSPRFTLGQSDNYFVHPPQPRHFVVLPDSEGIVHSVIAIRAGQQPSAFLTAQGYHSSPEAKLQVYNLILSGRRVSALLTHEQVLKPVIGLKDTLLVSFAILPYTDGTIAWQPVKLDTLGERLQTLTELVSEARARIHDYRQAGTPGRPELVYRNDVCPIIRRNGQYWVPRPYVLTGYFLVRLKRARRCKSDVITINVRGPRCTSDALLRQNRRHNAVVSSGNMLMKVLPDSYQFWTACTQYSHPPTMLVYGYNNFRYKPGIGIVSGKFEAYFSTSTQVVSDQFFDVKYIDGRIIK